MAIMVKKLFKNGEFLYKMRLIGGQNGMTNLVKWVHIIEDETVGTFLHGGELVFTAGILNKTPDWLLNFAHKLHEADVSAFVVNIGPHTREIPEEVIDYCNGVGMPLFTIPWETRMVDMTRDFCYRIMKNDAVETNLASAMKNIIFQSGDYNTQIAQMERYGCTRDSSFCFVCVATPKTGLEDPDVFQIAAEKTAKNIHELFVSFRYRESLVVVLIHYSDAEIREFVARYIAKMRLLQGEDSFFMGVGLNEIGYIRQNKNFENALSAMRMAEKRRETCSYYDDLGVYKVLYDVGDRAVLRGYFRETVGKIEAYDRENGTELLIMLRTYLESNGSLQTTAERLYVHRNTVTNQLKKIQKITGLDPLNLEDKVQLFLGFYIQDIL